MARISLLFSLALVLAIGSISAHPPSHKKTQKTLCPPTLSKLQTFPYTEISKLIEKKSQTAPNTIQFKTLFAFCKAYNHFLGAFKVAFAEDVIGSVQTKYTLMTQAMLAAQASVGVRGELAVELKKSYTAMAKEYGSLVEKIAEISAKYKFDDDATLSKKDRIKIDRCLIKLKGSIRVFIKVITKCSKKFSVEKKTGLNQGIGGFTGALVNHDAGFSGKLIGLGGVGQAEAGAQVGANVGAHAGAKVGAQAGVHGEAKVGANAGGKVGAKAGAYVGSKVGAHVGAKVGAEAGAKVGAHARAKVGAQAGVHGEAKVGANAGGKVGGKAGAHVGANVISQAGANVGAQAGAKVGGKAGAHVGANVGAQAGANVGPNAGAKVGAYAGVNAGGLFRGFLGLGGKAQFDAGGNAKVGGGNGFSH